MRTLVAALVLALIAGALAGCTRTQRVRDPLAPSDSPERVLRTLRLAGVEHAVAGERRGTAVVRLEVPAISSAGDVEVAWQLAVVALAEAYPRSRTYAVQLFGPGAIPLVEFSLRGREARRAIEQDAAAALREAASVRYLFAEIPTTAPMREALPDGAEPLPDDAVATGSDVSGEYLDAKNGAAGLSGDAGRNAVRAKAAAARTRLAVPGRPAPGVDEDAALVLAGRLTGLLGESASKAARQTPGAPLLREFAASVRADADPATVLGLRMWHAVVEAVATERPFGSVIGPARDTARGIAAARTIDPKSADREGRLADAILVAAERSNAPASMKVVTRFIRSERFDVSASRPGFSASLQTTVSAIPSTGESAMALPREALSRIARGAASEGGPPQVSWETTAGVRERVAPAAWLAYLRGDGRMFWLAGVNGPVALTDSSVTGWAWSARRAAVVDARDVGRVLSTIDLR